jgi:hypothetical protein
MATPIIGKVDINNLTTMLPSIGLKTELEVRKNSSMPKITRTASRGIEMMMAMIIYNILVISMSSRLCSWCIKTYTSGR